MKMSREGSKHMDMQEKDIYREESGTLRTRRVGSVTFGMTLILFGVLFLLHIRGFCPVGRGDFGGES